MTWKIALFEFKLMRRNLIYWIVLFLMLAFMVTEIVLPGIETLEIAHSPEPVMYEIDSHLVDMAEKLRTVMQASPFSKRVGWVLYDRILLLSTLLMSLFSVSVWSRDKKHNMTALIHSRNVLSWQYVCGKAIGLFLTYLSQIAVVFAAALALIGYISVQWKVAFSPIALLAPFLAYGLVTLVFSIAFALLASLVINNPSAAFLLHFLYWIFCVTKIGSFSNASRVSFMTQWMIRFDSSMDVNMEQIIDGRMVDLLLNRGLYLTVAMILLILAVWQYQQRRENRVG